MAYKHRHKTEKKCYGCNERFTGFNNQIYCRPFCGYAFRNHGHLSNVPSIIKKRKEAQDIIDKEMKRKQ